MIIYPIHLELNEQLGSNEEVSLALFCAEFSYAGLSAAQAQEDVQSCKQLGLHSILLTVHHADCDLENIKNKENLLLLHDTVKYCCEYKLFVIVELDFCKSSFSRCFETVHTLLHSYYHTCGGKLLGFVVNSKEGSNALLDRFSDGGMFVWQRYEEGFFLANLSVSNKLMHARKLPPSAAFEQIFQASYHFISQGYTLLFLSQFSRFLHHGNEREKHRLKEFLHSIRIYSDYCFVEQRIAEPLADPSLSSLNAVSCFVKKANNIGLLMLIRCNKDVPFNSIGFDIRDFQNKPIAFPDDLILLDTYAIFPLAMQLRDNTVDFMSAQLLYRFVYHNKEIWFCKEIRQIPPQISIAGQCCQLEVMKQNHFQLHDFELEIYCVSRHDERMHAVLLYRNHPYLLLSNMRMHSCKDGVLLQSSKDRDQLSIMPCPEFILSSHLRKVFLNTHYAAYVPKIAGDLLQADIISKNGAYCIPVPESLKQIDYTFVNEAGRGISLVNDVLLKLIFEGSAEIIIGRRRFQAKGEISFSLGRYYEDILHADILIISDKRPTAYFYTQVSTYIYSRDAYPYELI